MTIFDVTAIAVALSWAGHLSQYDAHGVEPPEVIERDHSWFIEVICNGEENCVIVGTYNRFTNTINMSRRVGEGDELEARSYLVHEMCHYLQWKVGGTYVLDEDNEVVNGRWLERECYAIQQAFMTKHGQPLNLYLIPDSSPYSKTVQ